MSPPVEELGIAELRVLMRRAPVDGDRCSCGATYVRSDWDLVNRSGSHSHYPRYPHAAQDLPRQP